MANLLLDAKLTELMRARDSNREELYAPRIASHRKYDDANPQFYPRYLLLLSPHPSIIPATGAAFLASGR